ncbi:MAG TPA: hypothetical protein PLR90_03510 [Methylophilus sp.]|nr:hypothetical protein [Methylophilus sp.]HQQ32963.1 hypothetical protein [Methylophilus sp.]
MNDRIRELLSEINRLEDELRTTLDQQQSNILFHMNGKKVEFEQSIKQAHRKLRRNFFRWLVTYRPQNLITGPIIYSMIIPLVITDVFVSFYQLTCFPIYGIKKVKRSDYFIYDRHHLNYLNFIEKFHCNYCAYANGLVGYITEIIARTEQYFCPIKHAKKVIGTHRRYAQFMEYGEPVNFAQKQEEFRQMLAEEK